MITWRCIGRGFCIMEIWKDVKGYEGYYKVSNLGNVKSLNYKRTGIPKNLKLIDTVYGYKSVSLGRSKRFLVHRLVAESFITNKFNKKIVNHKNFNKKDNRVENLEWCSQRENMLHAWEGGRFFKVGLFFKKLEIEDYYDLTKSYLNKEMTQIELSKKYNINQSQISRIIKKYKDEIL